MRTRLAALFVFATFAVTAAQPPGVIFDTDMGNDVDDALALAMLHALESRGECRLGHRCSNVIDPSGCRWWW